MPTILTPVSEYTEDVAAPDGGEARVALSVRPAFQKLLNWSQKSRDRLNAIGAMLSPEAGVLKSRTLVFASAASGWTYTGGSLRYNCSTNSGSLYFDLDVPDGAELTLVEALIASDEAMSLAVLRLTTDLATPGISTSADLGTDNGAGSGLELLSVTPTTAGDVHVKATGVRFRAAVSAGPNGADAASDIFYVLRYQWRDYGYAQPTL